MVTAYLCQCICGTGKGDSFDPTRVLGTPDLEGLDEIDEPPFQAPQIAGRLSYSVLPDQTLRGVPIREGELWYLSAEEKVEPIAFSLYVNGFSFMHDEQEVSISLSPFALVRNCKFQSCYSSMSLTDFKIFKVSLFTQGICYYFGVRGDDERQAEEERSRWVLDISRAMRLVTQSLFPPFSIVCDPIEAVAETQGRLMAGYLIHHDDMAAASVLYCELHPQFEDQAKLTLYENELCQATVMNIFITERSICCEKVGINCSCFCVEEHQFSTRSLSERKLWLRAISNVKVKLQNRAPSPSREDLRHYRLAIKEHIKTLRGSLEGSAPMDPLLQRTARRSFFAPPAPMDYGPPAPVEYTSAITVELGGDAAQGPLPVEPCPGNGCLEEPSASPANGDLSSIQLRVNSKSSNGTDVVNAREAQDNSQAPAANKAATSPAGAPVVQPSTANAPSTNGLTVLQDDWGKASHCPSKSAHNLAVAICLAPTEGQFPKKDHNSGC